MFKAPSDDGESGQVGPAVLATPASNVAKRTKQEIRKQVILARKHVDSPLLWAKCLLGTCYSVWFIHLPSLVLANNGSMASLRSGYRYHMIVSISAVGPIKKVKNF